MLELRRISKLFAGIPAVDDASFSARPGGVRGYLGPNGSGKSTMPGKSNVQFMFWAFVILFIPLAMMFSQHEQSVFDHPVAYALLVAILVIPALILWLFNRHQAKSAVLYFEELEPEVITTLGIGSWQPINQEVSAQNQCGWN